MATILQAIRAFELSASVQMYGGLRFGEGGEDVSGPTAIPCGRPFTSFKDMYRQFSRTQLDLADGSELLQGWKEGRVRKRLERFYEEGIYKLVDGVVEQRRTLVHGILVRTTCPI